MGGAGGFGSMVTQGLDQVNHELLVAQTDLQALGTRVGNAVTETQTAINKNRTETQSLHRKLRRDTTVALRKVKADQ